MTTFEFIVSFGILVLAMSVVMGIYFFMLQKRKESHYSMEKQKVELDLLRHNLESQVYELNERANRKTESWEDAYHLQLDGNNTKKKSVKRKKDFTLFLDMLSFPSLYVL